MQANLQFFLHHNPRRRQTQRAAGCGLTIWNNSLCKASLFHYNIEWVFGQVAESPAERDLDS